MVNPLDSREAVGLSGIGLLTLGAGLVYLPLAFLVPGFILLALAIVWRR